MEEKDKKELFKILADELNVKQVRVVASENTQKLIDSGYVGGKVEGTNFMLFLDTRLDAELIHEGLARDIVRRIQQMRKGIALEYTAKIRVLYKGDEEIKEAIRKYKEYISKETLAEAIEEGVSFDADSEQFKIGTHEITVAIHLI